MKYPIIVLIGIMFLQTAGNAAEGDQFSPFGAQKQSQVEVDKPLADVDPNEGEFMMNWSSESTEAIPFKD